MLPGITRFLCQPLYVSKRTIKHIRYTQYRGHLCRLCACVQSLLEEDFDQLKADQQTWKITGNSKRSKCSISSLTDCTTISWYGKSTWFNWYPLMPTKENINFTYKKVSYTQKKERDPTLWVCPNAAYSWSRIDIAYVLWRNTLQVWFCSLRGINWIEV